MAAFGSHTLEGLGGRPRASVRLRDASLEAEMRSGGARDPRDPDRPDADQGRAVILDSLSFGRWQPLRSSEHRRAAVGHA
jgi:hypothetical protein